MRIVLSAMILAGGAGLMSVPNAVASTIGSGIPSADVFQSVVEKTQYRRGRYCERLRRACEFKEERGEQGEGNCRRYRRECGRWR